MRIFIAIIAIIYGVGGAIVSGLLAVVQSGVAMLALSIGGVVAAVAVGSLAATVLMLACSIGMVAAAVGLLMCRDWGPPTMKFTSASIVAGALLVSILFGVAAGLSAGPLDNVGMLFLRCIAPGVAAAVVPGLTAWWSERAMKDGDLWKE